jgi:hypothetical protein
MNIIGYGEDFLTYYFFKNKQQDFKNLIKHTEFKDTSTLRNIFFRPSFGRKQHGEFDAIVSTNSFTYLIESKWDNLRKKVNAKTHIRPEQQTRHQNFYEFINTPKNSNTIFESNRKFIRNQINPRKLKNLFLYFYNGNINLPLPNIKTQVITDKMSFDEFFQIDYKDWLIPKSFYIKEPFE